MSQHNKPKFTLRFQNEQTHQMLGVVAGELGVSKNEFVVDAVESRLNLVALSLESELMKTVELLRGYRRDENLDRDIQDVAEAEVYEPDPLRSTMVGTSQVGDLFGVREIFSS